MHFKYVDLLLQATNTSKRKLSSDPNLQLQGIFPLGNKYD